MALQPHQHMPNINQIKRSKPITNYKYLITFASRVFPVPGGPVRRAPFGSLAPIALYFYGFFRKSTNS